MSKSNFRFERCIYLYLNINKRMCKSTFENSLNDDMCQIYKCTSHFKYDSYVYQLRIPNFLKINVHLHPVSFYYKTFLQESVNGNSTIDELLYSHPEFHFKVYSKASDMYTE